MNMSLASDATTNLEEKNPPNVAKIITKASLNPPISPKKSKISSVDLTLTVL